MVIFSILICRLLTFLAVHQVSFLEPLEWVVLRRNPSSFGFPGFWLCSLLPKSKDS